MTYINSPSQVSPTFNLKNLPDVGYADWRDDAVDRAHGARRTLCHLIKDAGGKDGDFYHQLTYVLTAYDAALEWQAKGIADRLAFGASYLVNPAALRGTVDVFEAALL